MIRTPPSTVSLVRGIGWTFARGVSVALPLTIGCNATRYTLVDAVVLYEGKSGGTALNRSTAYVDGIGWPVFGAMCLVLLPPILVGLVGAFAYGFYYPTGSEVFLTPPMLIPLEILTSSAVSIGSAAPVAVAYANRRFHQSRETPRAAATPASAPEAP